MTGKQKYSYIDVLKGIGILFVIIGHSKRPEIILKMIQSFHMPLFFMISGYLYNREKYRNRLSDLAKVRFRSYIIPYIKFAVFNYVIVFINNLIRIGWGEKMIDKSKRYVLGLIYSRGTWEWMPNCSPIWFLTAAFFASILFWLVMKGDLKTQCVLVMICLLIGAACDWLDIPKLFWNLDSAFTGVVFMWIGYYLRNGSALLERIHVPIALILAVVGLAAGYCNPIEFVSMDSIIYGNVAYMYAGAIALSIVLFYLSYKCIRENRILELYGRNTIVILGFNYLINDVVQQIWEAFVETDIEHEWLYICILEIVLLGVICKIWEEIKKVKAN